MLTVIYLNFMNNIITVNREYFVSNISWDKFFVLNNFRTNDPLPHLALTMRIIFVHLIFALPMLSENILTTNVSRFTVHRSLIPKSFKVLSSNPVTPSS